MHRFFELAIGLVDVLVGRSRNYDRVLAAFDAFGKESTVGHRTNITMIGVDDDDVWRNHTKFERDIFGKVALTFAGYHDDDLLRIDAGTNESVDCIGNKLHTVRDVAELLLMQGVGDRIEARTSATCDDADVAIFEFLFWFSFVHWNPTFLK